MQNLLLRPFALSLLLLLAGCHGRFTPALPPGKDVLVSQDAASTKLAPADPRYQELQRWLASNRADWKACYTSVPTNGLFVEAGELHLQFTDRTVFAQTAAGIYQKSVEPKDYAFLRPDQPEKH